jgi:hypothetical protein
MEAWGQGLQKEITGGFEMEMPILKVVETLEENAEKTQRLCGNAFVEACFAAARYLVKQGEQIVDLQKVIDKNCSDLAYQQSRLHFMSAVAAEGNFANKVPISVEGYKAFRGTMKITPKTARVQSFELTGDWLYRPDTECWYGKGSYFGKDICTIVEVTG